MNAILFHTNQSDPRFSQAAEYSTGKGKRERKLQSNFTNLVKMKTHGMPILHFWFVSCFQGGQIIFFQSLSLLGYCLFPLDVGALICMFKDNPIMKVIVVCVTFMWSSWVAYPFMSTAVNPRRKALALYPVLLMYVSVSFLIIAID